MGESEICNLSEATFQHSFTCSESSFYFKLVVPQETTLILLLLMLLLLLLQLLFYYYWLFLRKASMFYFSFCRSLSRTEVRRSQYCLYIKTHYYYTTTTISISTLLYYYYYYCLYTQSSHSSTGMPLRHYHCYTNKGTTYY